MSSQPVVRFANVEWRPGQRLLLVGGVPVKAGSRALDLLKALVERRDRIVRKDELLDLVWPGTVVEEANLHVQVSALRKLLGATAIATIPGRGYRFVALVEGDAERAPPGPASESGRRHPGNLPAARSDLIGRSDELAALVALLRTCSCVTVAGPGGIGKSRLAMEVAASSANDYADGAWWIDLTSVDRPDQVPRQIAQALEVVLDAPHDGPRLARAIADRSMLLVLDNCEHVIAGASNVVEALAALAPRIKVLATSQHALAAPGEHLFRIEPLAVPGDDREISERYGAIALFVARARAVHARFALDAGNVAAVAQICRELDGLPLAIELAAARVRHLGVQGVRDRLADRFRLLTSTADQPPRHRTLRTALVWSHAMLEDSERLVLRRLGVFTGGFTVELAQAVASESDAGLDEWRVLDTVGSLIDKSLVAIDAHEPVRYRLLETIRAFAQEQLEAHGETNAVRSRHARAMARYYEEVDAGRWNDVGTLSGEDARCRQSVELGNAAAALDWAMHTRDWACAVSLAGIASAAFFSAGRVHDVVPRMRALLPHVDAASPVARTVLLTRLGSMGPVTDMARDVLHAIKLRAVDSARSVGQRRRLVIALMTLASGLVSRGELDAARALVVEMRQLARPHDPPVVAVAPLSIMSTIHLRRHEVREAVVLLQQQRAVLSGADGDVGGLAAAEINLCTALNAMERFDEAVEVSSQALARPTLPRSWAAPLAYQRLLGLASACRVEEALSLARSERTTLEQAGSVFRYGAEALAAIALARGRVDDSVRIAAALDHYIERVGGELNPLTIQLRDRLAMAAARLGHDERTLDAWRAEGERLPERALMELALR
jgi:predicted ATPase/DNA-binding winged helix-turn-helix (wHTH) protein